MSTLNIVPKVIRNGTGSKTSFEFDFPVKEQTDVKVYVYRAADQSEHEIPFGKFDFRVIPTDVSGGTIVFPGADSTEPVLGPEDKICIMRSSRLGNDYVFTNQTRLLPESVGDADDSLSLQIMDLARDLSLAMKASPFDTRTPEERYNEIQVELKRAQQLLNFIENEYTTLPDRINDEAQARAAADEEIKGIISDNKSDAYGKIETLSSKLDAEIVAREAGDEEAVKAEAFSQPYVWNIGVVNRLSAVTLVYYRIDPVTGDTVQADYKALPVASEEQPGVMPVEAYKTLVGLVARVSALEGVASKSYALNLGDGELTQEDYQAAWEQASGSPAGSTPPDGTRITNLDTNTDIQYFATEGGWVVRGVSLPLATNDSVGVVRGASANGKITVETDGTMSLNGYDAINTEISSVKTSVQSETTRATNAESSITSALNTHKADTVKHLTAAERTAWNSKYEKPSSGIPAADLASAVQNTLSGAVTKSGGGTMTGQLVARSTSPSASFEVRNIKAVTADNDPGVGGTLTTGNILLVYE